MSGKYLPCTTRVLSHLYSGWRGSTKSRKVGWDRGHRAVHGNQSTQGRGAKQILWTSVYHLTWSYKAQL